MTDRPETSTSGNTAGGVAEHAAVPPPTRRIPTLAAQKLAERYGISAEAMEEIITGTRFEYTPDATVPAQPESPLILPPAETPQAAIEAAAAATVISAAAPAATSSAVEAPVPDAGNSAASDRVPPTPASAASIPNAGSVRPKGAGKTVGGGLLISIITVLLIGLGVALSFQRGCFRQRHQQQPKVGPDTIQALLEDQARKASTPPENPTPVTPPTVPPEALVVPREEPPGTTGTPSHAGATTESEAEKANGIKASDNSATRTPTKKSTGARHTTRAASQAPRSVLTTSSDLEAQERLAELRANGNTHARIRTRKRHGASVYSVETK